MHFQVLLTDYIYKPRSSYEWIYKSVMNHACFQTQPVAFPTASRGQRNSTNIHLLFTVNINKNSCTAQRTSQVIWCRKGGAEMEHERQTQNDRRYTDEIGIFILLHFLHTSPTLISFPHVPCPLKPLRDSHNTSHPSKKQKNIYFCLQILFIFYFSCASQVANHCLEIAKRVVLTKEQQRVYSFKYLF